MCRRAAVRNFAGPALPKTRYRIQETLVSKKKFALVLAVCAAATLLGIESGRLTLSSSQAQTPQIQASAASALPDFSVLVEQNGPAVVNISTTTAPVRTQMQLPQIPGDPGDQIQEFFRPFHIPLPQAAAIPKALSPGFL